jgi:FdhD protein
MTKLTHKEIEFQESKGFDLEGRRSQIAVESEVTLTVNGEIWLGFHCSPENLENLAIGFLFNESFIESAEEISSVTVCKGLDGVDVWLNHPSERPVYWNRSSGCEGSASQKSKPDHYEVLPANAYHHAEVQHQIKSFVTLLSQMGEFRNGVHSTALMDGLAIVSVCNDIGRHNTLDKIAGECLQGKKILEKPVLLTTGRLSSDMVKKAVRMRIGLVISLHSVSSQAIEIGRQLGIVLIGHARSAKWGVYTHAEMIKAQ